MKLFNTILGLFVLTLSSSIYAGDGPIAIKQHPTENHLVVALASGKISIVNSKSLKIEKSISVAKNIKKISFNNDGSMLWVHGETSNKPGNRLLGYGTKHWGLEKEVDGSDVSFSNDGSKALVRESSFAKELKIIDLTTGEKTGGIKIKFKNEENSSEFFGFSGDGKFVIISERSYGSGAKEIQVYNGDGYSSAPLRSYASPEGITDGFATGVVTKGDEHIVSGWSNSYKLSKDTCIALDRKYNYCSAFYASPTGDFLFIMDSKGMKYKFDDFSSTSIAFDKVDGFFGKVKSVCSVNDKDFYYVTNDFIIGKLNAEGFALQQELLEYTVSLKLRDSYKPEKVEAMQSALKKNGIKVTIPEKYDRKNPVIVKDGISIKDAHEYIQKMRKAEVKIQLAIVM